jgi:hypothetical protein
VTYVTYLLEATGLPPRRARSYALLFYSTLIGAAGMHPPATRAELAAMVAAIAAQTEPQTP